MNKFEHDAERFYKRTRVYISESDFLSSSALKPLLRVFSFGVIHFLISNSLRWLYISKIYRFALLEQSAMKYLPVHADLRYISHIFEAECVAGYWFRFIHYRRRDKYGSLFRNDRTCEIVWKSFRTRERGINLRRFSAADRRSLDGFRVTIAIRLRDVLEIASSPTYVAAGVTRSRLRFPYRRGRKMYGNVVEGVEANECLINSSETWYGATLCIPMHNDAR